MNEAKARKLATTSKGPFVHSFEPRKEPLNVTCYQGDYPMFRDFRVNREPRSMNVKGKI